MPMNDLIPPRPPAPVQLFAERTFSTFARFLHIEAASGIVLLIAAAAALAWANSPWADAYHALWHLPLSIGVGSLQFSRSLHFWINDALMTVFFLVVGMEIRRELHAGALAEVRQAALPLAAALGGVAVPALIYLSLNSQLPQRVGWAVPTATDIAFAVGVLALLGRSIPANVRVFLLAIAIIDDVAAVLIIALFYSGGLDPSGLLLAGAGIVLVLGLQVIGVGSALAYVLPGALLWFGLLQTGAHPTLAGVVLGLMTPVLPARMREVPLQVARRAVDELHQQLATKAADPERLEPSLRNLRRAQREILPPVTRVQMALHPWVAFAVMPLFALANAGVSLEGVDLAASASQTIALGVVAGLVLGKPLGIFCVSWLMVRVGLCQLPPGVDWRGVMLVGLLAGIGFTMSIFIATLGFVDASLLAAAKLGVLLASTLAACLGLTWGVLMRRAAARAQPL